MRVLLLLLLLLSGQVTVCYLAGGGAGTVVGIGRAA